MGKETKEHSLVPTGPGIQRYYVKPLKADPSSAPSRFGTLKILPVEITLEVDKHMYSVDKGKTFHLDSKGFRQLAGAIGANIVTPQTILWGGEKVNNPHVIYDDNGNITGAACRKVLIGLNPQGDLMVTDAFVQLDINLLFAERIRAKIEYKEEAGTIMTLADWKLLKAEERKGYGRIILHYGRDDYETTVIHYKLSHKDIKKVFKERAKLAQELVRRVSSVTTRRLCQESPLTDQPGIPQDQIHNYQKIDGGNMERILTRGKRRFKAIM